MHGNWSPGLLDWGGGLGTEDHGVPRGQVKPGRSKRCL